MSYKEMAAQQEPDTKQIENKIRTWTNARGAATNKVYHCETWLRKLCYALPDKADHLLAWLLDCQCYATREGIVLVPRSKKWEILMGQYLYPHVSRDLLMANLGKIMKADGAML